MRVLIVDDDSDTAELTAECLMIMSEVSVQIASTGAAALLAVAHCPPDTILLDVDLRGESGLDLAPELKKLCPGQEPRIIIFSGTVPRSNSGALPPGVDAWLAKPAHLEEIQACITGKPDSI